LWVAIQRSDGGLSGGDYYSLGGNPWWVYLKLSEIKNSVGHFLLMDMRDSIDWGICHRHADGRTTGGLFYDLPPLPPSLADGVRDGHAGNQTLADDPRCRRWWRRLVRDVYPSPDNPTCSGFNPATRIGEEPARSGNVAQTFQSASADLQSAGPQVPRGVDVCGLQMDSRNSSWKVCATVAALRTAAPSTSAPDVDGGGAVGFPPPTTVGSFASVPSR